MRVIADLHIHSRFSRAVSPQMVIPVLSEWAEKKGIDVVSTGDWTHPIWLRELQSNLKEVSEGLYGVKGASKDSPRFLLSTEINSIYTQDDKGRRVHTVVFAPNFKAVEKINETLVKRGANLLSDGRPITGLPAAEIAEIAFDADKRCVVIPAHVWTPWYSLYGSKSGFDTIEECFGDLSSKIYAVETGLSSDPAMNWKIEELQDRRIVSFSDAHSPQKLGREATVFDVEEFNYDSIRKALMGKGEDKIAYTIEFYPEEGKYHYTGHRKCDVTYSPKIARKRGLTCPVCGKPLTIGVTSRVESLAAGDVEIESRKDRYGVRWIRDIKGTRTPYIMLVPLAEIISEALSSGVGTQTVTVVYDQLINTFGTEFKVLTKTPIDEIEKIVDPKIAEGVAKVRSGDIVIEPGYDGVFGKVAIWKDEEAKEDTHPDQATLF